MSCRTTSDPCRRQTATKCGMREDEKTADGLNKPENEDIKDFAETTMNELLGWYGYGKVSSTDEAKHLKLRMSPSSSSGSPDGTEFNSPTHHPSDMSEREGSSTDTPVLDVDSISQENGDAGILCTWCMKNGLKLFTLKTANGQMKTFCSELCFDQCRRAAFKKNRICDWCKHVRHTVNYVDFQDKDHQLQFCSNKCLNQYKMNIFCKETQAYLQMHPQLQEPNSKSSNSSSSASSNLITPDLWLRDCKDNGNGIQGSSDEEEIELPMSFPNEAEDLSSDSKNTDLSNLKESLKLASTVITSSLTDVHHQPLGKNNNGKRPTEPTVTTTTNSRYEDNRYNNRDRRKKHRVSDRDSMQKPDRRSSRYKSNSPESHVKPAQPNSRYFVPDSRKPRQLSPPSYPPPLINGSTVSRNGGRSSSPSLRFRMGSSSSSSSSNLGLPAGLPPPPPLLNTELLNPHYLSQMFQQPPSMSQMPGMPPQQQLEALLAAQSELRMRLGMHGGQHQRTSAFPDHPMHPVNPGMHQNSSLVPPATVMLPYPLVLPLPIPIPIPIPIPLSTFLSLSRTKTKMANPTKTEQQARRVDSIVSKLMTKHGDDKGSEADSILPKSINQSSDESTEWTTPKMENSRTNLVGLGVDFSTKNPVINKECRVTRDDIKEKSSNKLKRIKDICREVHTKRSKRNSTHNENR